MTMSELIFKPEAIEGREFYLTPWHRTQIKAAKDQGKSLRGIFVTTGMATVIWHLDIEEAA